MNGEGGEGGKDSDGGGVRFHIRLVAAKAKATGGNECPPSHNGNGKGLVVQKAPEVEREFNMSAETAETRLQWLAAFQAAAPHLHVARRIGLGMGLGFKARRSSTSPY
jgi:hypothetical protein